LGILQATKIIRKNIHLLLKMKKVNKLTKNMLAICIAILPINIIMIWYRLTQTENFTTTDMTVYPLLFGGGTSILILLLNKYLIKYTFKETFNSGKGIWYSDILIGIGLAVIYFAMFFLERATLYQWIPNNNPPNTELIDVMMDLANSPMLMVIWFGPVLWIGIALFEELSRTFLLKTLWNMNKNKDWHVTAIMLASALIGLVHSYQGAAGIISIALKSVVISFYFYKYRRILPLIIAHGLYDGLQFAFFVIQFRQ
jgi:membrane protease YdiL (CAAX protease family)